MARVAVPITVVDLAGNAVQGASVTIRKRSDNSLATLYVAETGGTTTGNPVATNTQGRTNVWVDRNAYAATITGTGITTYTENLDLAAAKDSGIDLPWLGSVTPGLTVNTLATRPAAPSSTRDIFYATDDWGGTIYGAKADLSGWYTMQSKNEQTLTFSGGTSGTFTGLNGDVDEYYRIDYRLVVAATAAAWVMLRPNGVTTATYEYLGFHSGAGVNTFAGMGGTTDTGMRVGYNDETNTQLFTGDVQFSAKSGVRRIGDSRYSVTRASGTGALNRSGLLSSMWPDSAANIVTLDVATNGTGLTGTAVLRRMKTPA